MISVWKPLSFALLLAAAPLSALAPASAQEAPITTADIIKRGTARIGVLTGAPPFGMVDAQGNPSGYDVDVANLLAKYLGVKAEIIPLTPPARMPALESGRVDFMVATLAPTPERARAAMFTIPYSAFEMVIMAPKGSNIKSLADLAGKSVAVNRGSSQEQALIRQKVPGIKIVRFEDDSTSAQALFAGQVDTVAIPNTIGLEIKKSRPDADAEVKFIFFRQPNSIAVRKDQYELHQWLNNTIYFIKVSGELDEIFQKWTGSPLPELPTF